MLRRAVVRCSLCPLVRRLCYMNLLAHQSALDDIAPFNVRGRTDALRPPSLMQHVKV